MLDGIFRRKKEEKERKSDALINGWEYPRRISDLAELLEVSNWSIRNFLKRKGVYRNLKRDARGVMISQEIVDRILGHKSNPPEQIDELEYSYPPSWLAQRMGVCKRTVRRWIRKKGIVDYCERDGRGWRIKRSICAIICPEINNKDSQEVINDAR